MLLVLVFPFHPTTRAVHHTPGSTSQRHSKTARNFSAMMIDERSSRVFVAVRGTLGKPFEAFERLFEPLSQGL